MTAKALATGQGYRIISLPDSIPQTKFPVLFIALLAAVWRIHPHFPENVIWLKLIPSAAALVWFWAGYRWTKARSGNSAAAASIALLTAAAPWTLFLSATLLSETLFAALLTVALLVLQRIEAGSSTPRHCAILAVLASAAFLTRTAGAALIVAVVLTLSVRRRFKLLMAFLAISVLICGPWLLWQRLHAGSARTLDTYYSQSNYHNWNILTGGPEGRRTAVLSTNLMWLFFAPPVLLDLPLRSGPQAMMLCMVLAASLLAGLTKGLRRLDGAHIFLSLYFGLLLTWQWPPFRFVAPVLPVVLTVMWEGAGCLLRLPGLTKTVSGVAVALAIVFAANGIFRMIGYADRTLTVVPPGVAADDWREVMAQVNWIRQHTPLQSTILCNLDPVIYLYTGRHAIRGFVQDPYALFYTLGESRAPLGTPNEFAKVIQDYRVDYVVGMPNPFFAESPYLERMITAAVAADPGTYRLAYVGNDPRYRIYRVLQRGRAAEEGGGNAPGILSQ